MNIFLLFLMIIIPFEHYQFTDIKGNNYEINKDYYILIFLNGWNCLECIEKTTEYLKTQDVPKANIYFVIETNQDIYNKVNLKKMVEKNTCYYNKILFNPENVNLNDLKTSYFLKYSDNNRTPAILIKSDKFYFYQYDNIFHKNNEVKIDSIGVEALKNFKD